MNSEHNHIIYYDGECGFCNRSVQWILRRDKHQRFHFAALQSPIAQKRIEKYGIKIKLDTIILESEGHIHQKSDAILHTLYIIGGGWRLISFLKAIPRPLRNPFYTLFARNRHRFAPQNNQCMLLEPAQKARFIDIT